MSILEEIRKLNEIKERRSERGSELYLNRVRNRAEVVKQRKLLGEQSEENRIPEVQMRALFMGMSEKYHQKRKIDLPADMTKRGVALWKRVVSVQKRSEKSPEQFLKAQFAYFDKHFGCAPKLYQLTTEAAIERANGFGNTKTSTVSGGVEYKLGKAEQYRAAESTLLRVQRAQGLSREEVYRNLVIPGHLFISPDFLKIDPTYSKVVKDGN